MFFALAFCAASVGQTSAYLQDYSRAKSAANLIFQLIWKKSEIDPLSITGSKPVRHPIYILFIAVYLYTNIFKYTKLEFNVQF